MKVNLVLGGPGAGKTTRLLKIMEYELEQGIQPDEIAFVSFTRKAANEAKDRAKEKFGYNKNELVYFRTLHSLAYWELGINKLEVINKHHLKEFGKKIGVEISGYIALDDNDSALKEGDRLLFIESFARNTRMPVESAAQLMNEPLSIEMVKWFADQYVQFKANNFVLDFTDMLDLYLQSSTPLDYVKVAIIDEAQDLTPLQWMVAERAFVNCDRIYVAGDDDQAIYGWAGADIKKFRTLDTKNIEVLPVSYRLPNNIFIKAKGLAVQIKDRYVKEWGTNRPDGIIDYVSAPEYLPITDENWLLLGRNTLFLKAYEQLCFSLGFLYSTRWGNSVDQDEIRAIQLYEQMREGKKVSLDNKVFNMMQKLGFHDPWTAFMKLGYKKGDRVGIRNILDDPSIWHEQMKGIPLQRRNYYVAVLRRGRKLKGKPRIHINTIHGVKGGEADNVAVMTDMTYRTHENLMKDPDSEMRVFYVGITRAKRNLFIVQPQTNCSFYGL